MSHSALSTFLRRRPLVLVAPPFVLGARYAEALLEQPGLSALVACALTLLVLCVLCPRQGGGQRALLTLCLVAGLGGLLAGSLKGAGTLVPLSDHLKRWEAQGALPLLCARPVLLQGRLVGLPEVRQGMREDYLSFELELDSLDTGRLRLPLRGRIRLSSTLEGLPSFTDVGRLECWASLRRYSPPANPGATPRRGGPTLHGRLSSPRLLRILDHDAGLLDRCRRRLSEALTETMAGAEGEGLARALVLGARDGLEPGFVESLRSGGVAHVLAVSGLHLALVTGLVASLGARLGMRRRSVAVCSCLTALSFAALAGFGVPVVRAALLVVVFSAGSLLGRRADRWNALAAAALGAAWVHPDAALSLGFVLTFGAAVALMSLRPVLLALLPEAQGLTTYTLTEGFAASCAVWLALAPVTLSGFHRLNLLAPLVNLVVVPLAALATCASLVTALLSLLSPDLACWSGRIVSLSSVLLETVGSPAAWGELRLPEPSSPQVLSYLGGLWAFTALRDPRLRILAFLAVLQGLHAFTHPAEPDAALPVLASFTMLDVGQGSATLVTMRGPDGRPWRALIDAGGRPSSRYDIGEKVVAPALWALGVSRLDALVLSHADADHLGGMPAVVRLFRPHQVLVGPQPDASAGSLAELLRSVRNTGGELRRIGRGQSLGPRGGATRLSVCWPPRWGRATETASRNELSLVLQLEWVDGKRGLALFPGDLTAAGERGILERASPSAAVLVLGHHGSRTSSSRAFLRAVKPRLALVSVGRHNRFGHPHDVVSRRLEGMDIPLMRSSHVGAVRVDFRSRGRGIVATVLPQNTAPRLLAIGPAE